jgi:pimeloyl-ACP methyl ester carboxylesterase
MHGVPASAWLYRKLVPELAGRGLRAIAFDLPGLGLADRPRDFDYRWTGLGVFAGAAVDALGLERFHLVVHDIGGPVGFELAAARPERVASLTITNTLIRVDQFRRPWEMKPFAVPVLGRIWLAFSRGAMFRALMRRTGLLDEVPAAEIDVYAHLLRRSDGGRAFLKIMRGFELTADKRALYEGVVTDRRRPVQIVWGKDDPALRASRHGAIARELVPDAPYEAIAGKHYFHDDLAAAVGERIASFVMARERATAG